jgi:acyl dehydratase
MDDEAGRAAGLDGAVGLGNLLWAYMTAPVRDWMSDDGRILRISCQFQSPNRKGQVIEARGEIAAIREAAEEVLVDLELSVVADGGLVLAPGAATVAFRKHAG